MKEFDTFFLTDLNEVKQDTDLDIIIRDHLPGKAKYRCQCVIAKVSADPAKYPDRLWPRLGRGQWVGQPWSIKIEKEVNKIPEAWR